MEERIKVVIKSKEVRIELKTKMMEASKEELQQIVNSGDTYRIVTFAGQYLEKVKKYNEEISKMQEEILELNFILNN